MNFTKKGNEFRYELHCLCLYFCKILSAWSWQDLQEIERCRLGEDSEGSTYDNTATLKHTPAHARTTKTVCCVWKLVGRAIQTESGRDECGWMWIRFINSNEKSESEW